MVQSCSWRTKIEVTDVKTEGLYISPQSYRTAWISTPSFFISSLFFLLFLFLLSSYSAAVFPLPLSPSFFFFYHSIPIFLISFLIQYFQTAMPFSYFGLINTPVFLSAFSSLLSLTFSPPSLSNLYLGHQLKLRSHQHPSLQQRAIADFCGLLDDRIRGSKPHSELCPFLGGLSSQGGWEAQLPPWAAHLPAPETAFWSTLCITS